MDIDEFLEGVRKRGPSKGTAPKTSTDARVSDEEHNRFAASFGFAFKCGVCGKLHKSSLTEKVQSVAACIADIVKEIGGESWVRPKKRSVKVYGDLERNYGLSVKFLPEPGKAETIRFSYRETNAFNAIRPSSQVFALLYPSLKRKFDEFSERLTQVFDREQVEELSVKEALGAPNTLTWVVERRNAFEQRAIAEFERLRKEQEASDPGMFQKAREWRKQKPERFKIDSIERGHPSIKSWFQRTAPDVEPIKFVRMYKQYVEADRILGWFDTLSGSTVWTPFSARSSEKALFDFALVDGFPAISWGLVGAKEMPRRGGNSDYKGATVTNFVSLWDGTVLMNMAAKRGEFELRDVMRRSNLVKVSAYSDDSVVVDKGDVVSE